MEVIEMLRSATGPDRALDNEIAIAIGLNVPSGDIAKRFVTLAATPAIALCVAALEARKAPTP